MKRSKNNQKSTYVALSHWMMRTAAWRDLDCVARCAYVELSNRYRGPGSNNGRLRCSLSQITETLHVSRMTALRALARLQDHGFIVLMKRGRFSIKSRQANEWRLTEFGCDVTGALATKDFARWEKPPTVSPENPSGVIDSPINKKTTVSPENQTGFVVIQHGFPGDTNTENIVGYGITREPVTTPDGITREPSIVYQGRGGRGLSLVEPQRDGDEGHDDGGVGPRRRVARGDRHRGRAGRLQDDG